jgi:hypothetical protein
MIAQINYHIFSVSLRSLCLRVKKPDIPIGQHHFPHRALLLLQVQADNKMKLEIEQVGKGGLPR